MLKPITYTVLLIAALGLSSCEKVIEIDLNTPETQLVIEGNITDQLTPQTIRISQSVPYTDSNVYPPVSGATVTVTNDQGQSWNFVETQPGRYISPRFKGEAFLTYSLRVNVNNVTYSAASTMPEAVKLDGLGLKLFTFGDEQNKQVEVYYQDPNVKVNQYRFVMQVNGLPVKRIFVENDRFTDGKQATSTLFYNPDNDSDKLKEGDEVKVEMQSVDKPIYTYWYAISQQTQNGPAAGVTPANPPSNINNNALGYFSAHTTESRVLIIK
jgi:hypothetical protein